MLRLLGVGALQQVPRGAAIPEVPAEERARRVVELEYREIRGIRVSLRCPLPGAEMVRSGIRRHGEVHGRNRTAEPGVGHVARGACHVLQRGDVHVEVHQLAESRDRRVAGALLGGRLPCHRRGWQCIRLGECLLEDGLDFAPDPRRFRFDIGRDDAGRIRIVRGWACGVSRVRSRARYEQQRDRDDGTRLQQHSHKSTLVSFATVMTTIHKWIGVSFRWGTRQRSIA